MDTTDLLGFAGATLAGYFAIMNPIANTPVFISLTAGDDKATKEAVARRGILLAFAIIAVLSIAGNELFKMFGISLLALGVTGGIVVFMIGYHMLQGSRFRLITNHESQISDSRRLPCQITFISRLLKQGAENQPLSWA